MGFFDMLAFLLAAAFLVAAFVRQKAVGTEGFQRAMMVFFAALIIHDLVPAIPIAGTYLGIVAGPVGYGLALWSFRDLCLAIAARTNSNNLARDEDAY